MFDKIAETPIVEIQGRGPVRVKTKSPLLSVVLECVKEDEVPL